MAALLTPAWGSAQELSVQAPQSVFVGDVFQVSFVVNSSASDFSGPSFNGFSLPYGNRPSVSVNRSGGTGGFSTQTVYSYTLSADKEGTFTIGEATCKAKSKQLRSKPFSISVLKPTQQQLQQRQQQRQQQQRQQYDPFAEMDQMMQMMHQQMQQMMQMPTSPRHGVQQSEPIKIDDKTIFARASVSNANPYQGEQIIITYKIYTQVDFDNPAIDKMPGYKSFWSEKLSEGSKVKVNYETIDGRKYAVVEMLREALLAQESGHLTIEPIEFTVRALVNDRYGFPHASNCPLKTNRLTINARPLPKAPDGFGGAVGRFEVKGGLNLDQVKANEALTYRVTVNGSGNLMLIQAPQPQFPSSFEVYEPQIDDNIKKSDNGISGSRSFEWVLIPRSQGNFTIPELKFVFFDPATGQYRTQTIEAQDVEVLRGDGRATAPGKDDVRLLNQDINYIHTSPSHLRTLPHSDHAGWVFWLMAILIVLGAVAAVVFVGRHREQMKDVAGMRMKRAIRLATKRLRRAAAFLGTSETARFYEEIYKAIWGCLSDKYSIPLSQLSRESVSQRLEEKQVSPEQQASIMQLLQDVDMARFAPGDASQHMQTVYNKALDMIAALS